MHRHMIQVMMQAIHMFSLARMTDDDVSAAPASIEIGGSNSGRWMDQYDSLCFDCSALETLLDCTYIKCKRSTARTRHRLNNNQNQLGASTIKETSTVTTARACATDGSSLDSARERHCC